MKHRLEELRCEKNLRKKDIANYLNVVESVYSEWENNKLSLPTKRIYELAEFYSVNIDYMLGLTNKRVYIKCDKSLDTKLVSTRIREIRKYYLKLTMRELASILNTTSSAISNYENDKFLILGTFLIELSRISNYSVDYILGRKDDKFIH